MKESDGLTAKGEHVYFVTKTPEELKNESSRADRLAAYENTGLSPEEVEKLKAENAELRARLERSVVLEYQKGDHVFFVSWLSGNICEGEVIGWQEDSGYVIICDDAMISSYRCFDTREEVEVRLKELEVSHG